LNFSAHFWKIEKWVLGKNGSKIIYFSKVGCNFAHFFAHFAHFLPTFKNKTGQRFLSKTGRIWVILAHFRPKTGYFGLI
jgi:hypothetical protein